MMGAIDTEAVHVDTVTASDTICDFEVMARTKVSASKAEEMIWRNEMGS